MLKLRTIVARVLFELRNVLSVSACLRLLMENTFGFKTPFFSSGRNRCCGGAGHRDYGRFRYSVYLELLLY
jgi:glutathionyl-hydroquinone reductase